MGADDRFDDVGMDLNPRQGLLDRRGLDIEQTRGRSADNGDLSGELRGICRLVDDIVGRNVLLTIVFGVVDKQPAIDICGNPEGASNLKSFDASQLLINIEQHGFLPGCDPENFH